MQPVMTSQTCSNATTYGQRLAAALALYTRERLPVSPL